MSLGLPPKTSDVSVLDRVSYGYTKNIVSRSRVFPVLGMD